MTWRLSVEESFLWDHLELVSSAQTLSHPGMQLCALETRKMDRNLEMSQRYPGPGRHQVVGSRGTWSLRGDKRDQVSVSRLLILMLHVVNKLVCWPCVLYPRSLGGGRQVVVVAECKWIPTW